MGSLTDEDVPHLPPVKIFDDSVGDHSPFNRAQFLQTVDDIRTLMDGPDEDARASRLKGSDEVLVELAISRSTELLAVGGSPEEEICTSVSYPCRARASRGEVAALNRCKYLQH